MLYVYYGYRIKRLDEKILLIIPKGSNQSKVSQSIKTVGPISAVPDQGYFRPGLRGLFESRLGLWARAVSGPGRPGRTRARALPSPAAWPHSLCKCKVLDTVRQHTKTVSILLDFMNLTIWYSKLIGCIAWFYDLYCSIFETHSLCRLVLWTLLFKFQKPLDTFSVSSKFSVRNLKKNHSPNKI